MPAVVADEAKAALDLATERMGSENEFYPFSPVLIENHEMSKNINIISGTPSVEMESSGPDASFGAKKLGETYDDVHGVSRLRVEAQCLNGCAAVVLENPQSAMAVSAGLEALVLDQVE